MDKPSTQFLGQGPRLLLLHGIGGSATAWSKQIERLSGDFACLAPDLPGYGDTPAAGGNSMRPFVQAMADLLAGEPAHVLGVSFGALLALALARHHPELVRSLVLADATLGRAHMTGQEREKWLEKRRSLSGSLQEVSVERAAEIASPAAAPEIIDEIARHMRRARPDGYMAVANAIAATDARPWLESITQPALVLCGEDDRVTGAEVSRVLVDSLPHARLRIVPRSGHAPHIEQPDVFAREVREFLLEPRPLRPT
ncbi:alpha/beta fold hydrolase [Pusillimonas noertemannii]|uniref:Pimeloyl-ACP methyl ester carboxylesterase n=1 Tax=Pusillimonas noertemannii TaxID=305977 RepID=A0A2U1CMS4_9BURK|nr:alpha/beta hydrolase [Pusillimonas noertemannii]NYT68673.1 alpha/beta hydrolase [Pusillimonas noertemannii]PVY62309.1 pimeloyl-ACP methyl ester carboxylesterase [Pusillimonas noertemannii]TFL10716.1 alpha/beta hydrolase [Pusillimonas noertemannii]